MAGRSAVLALKITGDARDGVRALDEVEGKAGRMDGVFGKMGAGIASGVAIGVTALAGLAVASFNSASDLQQSSGAVESVFGDMADQIKEDAGQAATAVGLSASAYENLASVLGSQLRGAGLPLGEVAGKTEDLISKGADLAATFGGSTADAVSALSSVLKGEYDPIERYGVSIKQSDVNARLAAEGNDKLTGAALKTASANAALALLTEQTATSQGSFARESDTAAGAQQRLSATWENAKAALGQGLLPIVAGAATFLTGVLGPAVQTLTDKNGFLTQAFGAVSDFVTGQFLPVVTDLWNFLSPKLVPILGDMGSIITGTVVPAFQTIWAFVKDYAVPILKTVLGPVLDGVRGMWDALRDALDRNKDKFSDLYENLKPFLDFLKNNLAPFVGGYLSTVFGILAKAIGPVVDLIAYVLQKGSQVAGVIGKVGSLFGGPSKGKGGSAIRGAAPLRGAAAGGPGAGLFGATSSLGGVGVGPTGTAGGLTVPVASTTNVTVNVRGFVGDRYELAREIKAALSDLSVAQGRSVAVAL